MLYRNTFSQQHSTEALPRNYSLSARSGSSSDRGGVADGFEKPRLTNYEPKITLPKLPNGKQFESILQSRKA